MPNVFTFHTDAGHGWLEVPRGLLADLQILGDITPYSYQHGDAVYLEEDCDAGRFADAFAEVYGARPFVEDTYQDPSPVRAFARFVNVSRIPS